MEEKRKVVVVDTDAGSDDAAALLLLLALERENNLEVAGITCTHGNADVDNVARNVLLTLESAGRSDIPVYRGAECPLIPLENSEICVNYFSGKDGFADLDFDAPKGSIKSENGVVALNRIAMEIQDAGIILLCLGPLTNIALAIRTYPEFSKCLSQVYIMGGNIRGVGNTSWAAEFNFYKDPEAAHIVLSSLSCPVTILPWEPCQMSTITVEERFEKMKTSCGPHMTLLNKIDSELYRSEKVWNPCDAFLVSAFLDEASIKKSGKVYMTVELHGLHTRGQTVIDHRKTKPPNVRVIEEIDFDIFKKIYSKMATCTTF